MVWGQMALMSACRSKKNHGEQRYSMQTNEGINLHFVPPSQEKEMKVASCSRMAVDMEAKNWKNTLVGNFMGRRPSYSYVKEVTNKLWKRKGGMEVALMDSGVFIFRFNCEEDKQKILENGQWIVARKPLFLRAWSPKLEMRKINLSSGPRKI